MRSRERRSAAYCLAESASTIVSMFLASSCVRAAALSVQTLDATHSWAAMNAGTIVSAARQCHEYAEEVLEVDMSLSF